MLSRTFLISPAYCGGKRAKLLMNADATFPLARRMSLPGGAEVGEVFSFVSGLYFRGKLAYARAFAHPGRDQEGTHIITPTRGLVSTATLVTRNDLAEFAMVDIAEDDARFRGPFARDVAILAAMNHGDIVLLGSVATGKYVDVLLELLGDRLLFPADFVGRGDMSRGGLLLRCVKEGRELDYVPVASSVRTGRRPPRLSRLS